MPFILFFKFGLICTTFFFSFLHPLNQVVWHVLIHAILSMMISGVGLQAEAWVLLPWAPADIRPNEHKHPHPDEDPLFTLAEIRIQVSIIIFIFALGFFSSFSVFVAFLAPFSYVVTWRKSSSHWTRVSGMGLPADAHSASQTFQCVHGVHVRRYFDDTNVASLH